MGPLKKLAAEIWGSSASADRDKLQRFGMAVRDIDSDALVRLALRKIQSPTRFTQSYWTLPHPGNPNYVVDDMRFPNEWWALKAEGFVIVRVTAPVVLRIDRLKATGKFQEESQLEHASETAIDHLKADYEITNDGDMLVLQSKLAAILNRERLRR
jgi:hypothetical protein